VTVFDQLLADIGEVKRRFTVYASDGHDERDDGADIEERFASRDVDVDYRTLPPGGPEPFVLIEEDGEFAGVLGARELRSLLEPPIVRPWKRTDVSEGYRVLFEVLDGTVFTALERRNLLAVSREIEDRAYRVGTGTLRVSFQTLSTFESQADAYRDLAAETDLDVHIYGLADWTPPEIPGITFHGHSNESIGRYWVLAFDGGSDATQACGLVAREQPDGYLGVWTSDPGTVRDVADELAATERESTAG